MKKLKVLELFAGTRSIGKSFEAQGHEVYSIEWDEVHPNIDWYTDINNVTSQDILEKFGRPDIIWCSFDCTTYSIAAISHHRTKTENTLLPKSEKAKFADKTNLHVLKLIEELEPKFYFIENPRGGLRKMDFMSKLPRYTVTYCFAGETKVATPEGDIPIKELSGGVHKVLTKGGEWVEAPFREYGVQPLMKITLSRSGKEKIIHATPEHLWFTQKKLPVPTKELKTGDRLEYVTPKQKELEIIPEWVARGFLYGDGWVIKNRAREKSFVQFVEEKHEIMKYFEGFGGKRIKDNHPSLDITKIYGFPREWKTKMPTIKNSPSEIFSWIAGYFAADGSLSNNHQFSLSSAVKEDLEHVRSLARFIGIETYGINEYWRKGYNEYKTPIYSFTFMRETIPSSFVLRSKHKKNMDNKVSHQPRKWVVKSIEKTERIEMTYCAEVKDTHAFSLEDGILTHNCQYGDIRMKPTDIWTNHPNPKFKPMCKNGAPCHESAPRGSKTGTQGLKCKIDRSRIPKELCDHIASISEE